MKEDYKRIINYVIQKQFVLNNNSKYFWKDVKKATGGKTKLPSYIDGVTGDENISNIFAENYKDLYNSVPYNVDDMNCLQKSIEDKINCSCVNNIP